MDLEQTRQIIGIASGIVSIVFLASTGVVIIGFIRYCRRTIEAERAAEGRDREAWRESLGDDD